MTSNLPDALSRAQPPNDDGPFPEGTGVPEEIEWALRQGWAVIPIRIDASGSKHPQVKEWTTKRVAPSYIRKLARKHDPTLLFAVVTGAMSKGLIVLDADTETGVQWLTDHGLPLTLRTPGGGAHVWVDAAGISTRSRNVGKDFPFEVKADGGSATFYGTNERKGGKSYEFTCWPPAVTPLENLP